VAEAKVIVTHSHSRVRLGISRSRDNEILYKSPKGLFFVYERASGVGREAWGE
jgi:hypothetical protein